MKIRDKPIRSDHPILPILYNHSYKKVYDFFNLYVLVNQVKLLSTKNVQFFNGHLYPDARILHIVRKS